VRNFSAWAKGSLGSRPKGLVPARLKDAKQMIMIVKKNEAYFTLQEVFSFVTILIGISWVIAYR
jgi:hypothetical protein